MRLPLGRKSLPEILNYSDDCNSRGRGMFSLSLEIFLQTKSVGLQKNFKVAKMNKFIVAPLNSSPENRVLRERKEEEIIENGSNI